MEPLSRFHGPAWHKLSCDEGYQLKFPSVVELSEFGSNFTNGFTSLSPGVLVSDTELPLEKRQYTCDPGYVLCSNMAKCCPAGDECFAEGCCPSGSIPCGAINPSKCHYSPTEKCCAGGSCRKDYDCCERQCCSPVGYCASDGYCSAKPCSVTSTVNAVQTRSTVVTSTRRATVTVFDAEEEQAGEALPEFTCPATTFTEDGNSASLELGDNCKLTLHVNEAEESSTPALRRDATPTTTTAAPALNRRQDITCTATLRGTTTIASTSWTTSNVTVTEAPSALPEFSCLAIVVTNSAGDELALGDDCSLEFTPAEESAGAQGDSENDSGSADGTSTSPESSSLTGPLSASTSGAKRNRMSLGLVVWCGVLFLMWMLL
ncbi:hypothetical protein M409DRAFT_30315 [Zasmidium cellare ATCC 36951]|uniref:Uncharacterized protein n=1 Tax=Zasmidium cellare ATCC 36951 TaxID=1080233 RepID=A0A6A6C0E8_ZASCE|nr:uncharacterized protein M409DRAFT_30315 [Zasmidium cellare ATCC 36951]KAF2159176.1 hypothetical protein M409DRAFT_30315 [Zasmidium cellare ATCC 36951]